MGIRKGTLACFLILALATPLAASSISPEESPRGGLDAEGIWSPSVELEIHSEWWTHWSRDKDHDSLDDRLEWLMEQPDETQRDWWRRAPTGSARIFLDYDHHPTDADVESLEALGVEVTFRFAYLDTLSATAPLASILDPEEIRALPGIVMVEDLGLAETNMHEAVPNMGVDAVWQDFGFDGTGAVIAVLDTGVRGDHEGLNDMDDDPFTCFDEPPDPDPFDPDPDPIPSDCDPKIIAFYDAVFTDEEQDPSSSYDSGTHGSHVAGIAAGTGGGQTDPETGLRYIGAAPGAHLINILGCCDGDIEDVMQGAQWAIDNKDKYGIDIVTSSLGEQQFEIHVDNDGNSAWSRQMDMVVEAGIITTLSAGNEFGGLTIAGCNTIDSPGDARLPVTVASLDKDLGLAIYSSRGYTSDLRVKPDVATIGSDIMAPDAATQDGYVSKSGTSMATPLMAGIAALMVQANPDLTPTEFKDIIGAHSIERDIQLLDDPGFNDCSILETRPDNEFGYGQADPTAFVEAAGSIDRSLNISMEISTMGEVLNESNIHGSSLGAKAGSSEPGSQTRVEVRVGGGEWKEAVDDSPLGNWALWSIRLEPHVESGNSTIYARLVVDDEHISPVDARRVILLDMPEVADESDDSGASRILVIAVALMFALMLGYVVFHRERLIEEWFDGESLTDNRLRRMVSLCILYFAQGLPWGFAVVAFVAYLAENGFTAGQTGTLLATIALPWTFKWIWGPVIDTLNIPIYGKRRLWVLLSQFGMAVTIGIILFVPNLIEQIDIVISLMFIHNIFASLQDVSTDALAVDVLQDHEVSKVNGYMFASKRAGMIVGGAVLGSLVSTIGIRGMLAIQLPLLLLIMVLPMFLYEKPGTRLFPWSTRTSESTGPEKDSLFEESDEVDEKLYWDDPEESRWWAAVAVGKATFEEKISVPAFITIISIFIFVSGLVFAIVSVDLTVPFYSKAKIVAFGGLVLAVFVAFLERLGSRNDGDASLLKVNNPFSLLPQSSMRTLAQTSFNLTKAFHLKSSFLLIFCCLLTEMYYFLDPIIIDILVVQSGWGDAKYSLIVGGGGILATMFGQISGGFLGEKFGVRRMGMIGFTCLAICNGMLAILEPFWTNTPIMVIYVLIKGFVTGVAFIAVVAVCMKMTWSKVGGTQFTAYMSMFNLGGVIALSKTGQVLEFFDNDVIPAIYTGAALTMIAVVFLIFIDPEECNRVLENKSNNGEVIDAEIMDADLGESTWWEDEGGGDSVTAA
ncbi:MAG TPA: MFS transporter [Candidatus Thalassarchaeaceae archaeon]|jgi:MFS family permease|nr:MFS transporter [Candidatus Thalassarchaeaceae archaeon]|tara:strand:- start:21726 stop:25475 length:3750 start_codon:yes stop_codon:yes gene_type:complete